MANTENKTKPTDAKVSAYIAALDNPVRRSDAERLLEIYGAITGLEPVLWGPSIIGFGSYHYKYDSGREGDSCRAGFSPRKASLSLYLMSGYSDGEVGAKMAALRERLGKHKTGASCLYINKLADVDVDVLREMIQVDWVWMNGRYPA
ncbi:MAG: DUF1801 domain-containing protein [Sphingorhabdus sp.]